eukprot:gene5563-15670_t
MSQYKHITKTSMSNVARYPSSRIYYHGIDANYLQ